MNKEDILLLVDYLKHQDLVGEDMKKLRDKLNLIKKQIEAQDIIQEVQKELQEMDKPKK